jgi:hypothetical protein
MYRQPYGSSFRYACGLYQQSHGVKCEHNTVDGVRATRFLLACVRQRVFAPGFRERLRERLEEIARDEHALSRPACEATAELELSLTEVRRNRALAETNMARAANEDQFRAISKEFDRLQEEERTLQRQLLTARQKAKEEGNTLGSDVDLALEVLDQLAPLAEDSENLGAVGMLFTRLNARMFFRFAPAKWGKRTVNKVSGGVVTFGATSAPIKLYDGPTGRRALNGRGELQLELCADGFVKTQELQVPGPEGDSLGNVSRADWI